MRESLRKLLVVSEGIRRSDQRQKKTDRLTARGGETENYLFVREPGEEERASKKKRGVGE